VSMAGTLEYACRHGDCVRSFGSEKARDAHARDHETDAAERQRIREGWGTKSKGGSAMAQQQTATFQCPDCPESFSRAASLGAHRFRKHGYRSPGYRSPAPATGEGEPTPVQPEAKSKKTRKTKPPTPVASAANGQVRVLLVRDGRVLLPYADFVGARPEFSFGGHRFRVVAIGSGGVECEVLA
jgi:hypothetical protein